MKKLCVIGHFGFGKDLLNGQTIKTRIFTEELEKQLGRENVIKVDTHGGLKAYLKIPFQILKALIESENVIIFPAHNGLRIIAPLLSIENRIFIRKLHYVVIGGWLPQMLESKKSLAKSLKRFDGIYVETNTMKKALEKQGFNNIFVMPNCKKLKILSENELVYPEGIPLRLCTFSRVMKEKGIEDAVNAVIAVNEKLGYYALSLDIYGQIDAGQTEWFNHLRKIFPPYIQYRGLVPFDKSVDVIKEYFALLFPTYYEGEGFAGTLLDAFAAGVPVIASDWKYNSELVTERTGYLFSTGIETEFAKILTDIALDLTLILGKKNNCLKEAAKYKVDEVLKVLVNELERE